MIRMAYLQFGSSCSVCFSLGVKAMWRMYERYLAHKTSGETIQRRQTEVAAHEGLLSKHRPQELPSAKPATVISLPQVSTFVTTHCLLGSCFTTLQHLHSMHCWNTRHASSCGTALCPSLIIFVFLQYLNNE